MFALLALGALSKVDCSDATSWEVAPCPVCALLALGTLSKVDCSDAASWEVAPCPVSARDAACLLSGPESLEGGGEAPPHTTHLSDTRFPVIRYIGYPVFRVSDISRFPDILGVGGVGGLGVDP